MKEPKAMTFFFSFFFINVLKTFSFSHLTFLIACFFFVSSRLFENRSTNLIKVFLQKVWRKLQHFQKERKKKSPDPFHVKSRPFCLLQNHVLPPSATKLHIKFVSYIFNSVPLTSIHSLPQEKEKCTHPSGPQNHKRW